MTDFDQTNPREELPASPEGPGDADAGPPRLAAFSTNQSDPSSSPAERPRQHRWWRLLSNKKIGRIAAVAVMAPVMGLSLGLATSPSASAAQPLSASAGSNARSGPAAGGSSGTVSSVSKSGFTMTTSVGQKVTVDQASSTKYEKGSRSIAASAIKKGTHVLVLGTVSTTTIKATQVIVESTGESVASTAATVVPFSRGAPTTSKQVGQIPASYTEGSGTIVSGTTANKATEAALAAYPGGIVDRVVRLSNGEYEVHTIGVNWPHHIFRQPGLQSRRR